MYFGERNFANPTIDVRSSRVAVALICGVRQLGQVCAKENRGKYGL